MSYYLFWINSKPKFLSSVVIKMLIRLPGSVPPRLCSSSVGTSTHTGFYQSLAKTSKVGSSHDHISHHLNSLSWSPINQQIQYRSLCAMHCHYLGDAIPFNPPITFGVHHGHNTHCPSSLSNLPRSRLSFTQHFFHYRTVKRWKQIPLDIVGQNRHHFMSALYSYLLISSIFYLIVNYIIEFVVLFCFCLSLYCFVCL